MIYKLFINIFKFFIKQLLNQFLFKLNSINNKIKEKQKLNLKSINNLSKKT
jgi:hypothetical protein